MNNHGNVKNLYPLFWIPLLGFTGIKIHFH